MLRFLVLVCLVILLAGCSALREQPDNGTAAALPAVTANKLDVIGQTPVGQSFLLEQRTYQVVEEYTAASGRYCRQLLEIGDAGYRVACRGKFAQWYLRDSLLPGRSVPKPSQNAMSPAAVVSVPDEPPLQDSNVSALPSFTVAQNENLWRFAKRVTGNALNWKAIAEINGVDNANALRSGQQLHIPAHLGVLPGANISQSAAPLSETADPAQLATPLMAEGS